MGYFYEYNEILVITVKLNAMRTDKSLNIFYWTLLLLGSLKLISKIFEEVVFTLLKKPITVGSIMV